MWIKSEIKNIVSHNLKTIGLHFVKVYFKILLCTTKVVRNYKQQSTVMKSNKNHFYINFTNKLSSKWALLLLLTFLSLVLSHF